MTFANVYLLYFKDICMIKAVFSQLQYILHSDILGKLQNKIPEIKHVYDVTYFKHKGI